MRRTPEQPTVSQGERSESEQEQRAQLISRFIETRVIGKNKSAGVEEEKELQL
jgi:hypothetical protein